MPALIDLNALVRASSELEPLPASVTRLAALVASGNWDLKEITDLIAFDQGLTTRVLRAANSAASASKMNIGTAREAVMRIGAGAVLSLALAASVKGKMQVSVPEFGLREGDLWRHSVAAALAAECTPALCTANIPVEAFTAALLHDIGKLVLARFLDRDTLDVLTRARRAPGMDDLKAESEVLQVHHGELGGLVAQHWGLPDTIARGIIYHHQPSQGRSIVCDCVHLANAIAHTVLAEPRTEQVQLEDGVLDRLGIDATRLARLVERVRERLESVLSRYE